MDIDRIKWDKKHGNAKGPGEPRPLLKQFVPRMDIGNALDLACGLGRHARFLAMAGWTVDAVDISPVALAQLDVSGIQPICADLDTYQIQAQHYQLILCTYFLDRQLWPAIEQGLAPGGWLLMETFLADNERTSNPAYKLGFQELPQAFPNLHCHHYEEKEGVASFAAQAPL